MNCKLAAMALAIALSQCQYAVAAAPPIETFFKPAEWSNATLSPDGQRLAVVMTSPGKRSNLAIVDMNDPQKSRLIAGFSDADVGAIQWVNDHRCV